MIENFLFKIYNAGITTHHLSNYNMANDFNIIILYIHREIPSGNPMLQINVASFITRLIWVP